MFPGEEGQQNHVEETVQSVLCKEINPLQASNHNVTTDLTNLFQEGKE